VLQSTIMPEKRPHPDKGIRGPVFLLAVFMLLVLVAVGWLAVKIYS
jgi:hypothetical protein